MFNELNVMYTGVETIKYLEGFDCPTELIDSSVNKEYKLIAQADDNGYSRFLKLFLKDNINNYELPKELKNTHYYVNESQNKYIALTEAAHKEVSLAYEYDKYLYKPALFYQKIYSQVDILSDVLEDLKLINLNISANNQ
jgi:hypothetical protein